MKLKLTTAIVGMARMPEATPDLLTLREGFERDGYLLIDPQIPDAVLDGAVADLNGHFSDQPRSASMGIGHRVARRLGLGRKLIGDYTDFNRISNAWRGSEHVKAIARAPRVLELLRDLYRREPLPFQTLNLRAGTQQPPHSDTIHFNSAPPGFMCGVWVALEDIDMDNGPLVYFPGSHKLPEITPRDVGVPPGAEHYGAYEEHIAKVLEREGLLPRHGTMARGEAMVWAANLLHGGALQADPNRTRFSQVTHYFFEDCRYWMPLESDERHTEWRDPGWIR
jgi:ectoine hydroxylase-related dioxygenase (phytanoyl-CoA dioxygenase family)